MEVNLVFFQILTSVDNPLGDKSMECKVAMRSAWQPNNRVGNMLMVSTMKEVLFP